LGDVKKELEKKRIGPRAKGEKLLLKDRPFGEIGIIWLSLIKKKDRRETRGGEAFDCRGKDALSFATGGQTERDRRKKNRAPKEY